MADMEIKAGPLPTERVEQWDFLFAGGIRESFDVYVDRGQHSQETADEFSLILGLNKSLTFYKRNILILGFRVFDQSIPEWQTLPPAERIPPPTPTRSNPAQKSTKV